MAFCLQCFDWQGASVVICLEQSTTGLHMVQLMYPSPIISCFMKTKNDYLHADTHTHPFNGPLSGTTQVGRYQKVKPIWILLKQETVIGSGISWAICKSSSCSRQITTPAPPTPDALPAAQPTASKHWRLTRCHTRQLNLALILCLFYALISTFSN